MSDFFEANKKGLSKNFSTRFGYRAYTVASWARPGFVELFLQKVENGKRWRAKRVEIVWEPDSAYDAKVEPFLEFDCGEEHDRDGTSLLDALQDLFTPKEKKERPFIEGELAATKQHLGDMRGIALQLVEKVGGVSLELKPGKFEVEDEG